LDFTAALHRIEQDIYLKRRKELLDFIEFREDPKRLVRELSGGTKQEVSLVAALIHDPAIVFLDEPTAGVSPAARVRFWSLIQRLADTGKTVFVTTHYMDEAEHCGRIALMRDGRMIALDSPANLKKNAFPEPLFELTPLGSSRAWVDKLMKEGVVLDLNPYGMRYHAIVKDAQSFHSLEQKFKEDFESRPIDPSLEDVFVRLVEGGAK
jgi:ABC-2 type transport system ATP-binding protein